jgi:putative membrane-bound dehydrogenase-like protein
MPHLKFVRAGALFLTASLIAPLSSAANPHGIGAQAAVESLKDFKLAPGLKLSLFAAEPMLRNPTDMDVDDRGRVWITEGVNYRSSFKPWGTLQPEGDRIVILEDTNGDGSADKQITFYQDPSINAALGICVLGNKVIVSDSPNVFVLTDTNGDGIADKRELLFTGISGFDHDHGVHAFTFGPDGKLYFNMGNEGKQLRRPTNRNLPLHGLVTNVVSQPVIDLDGNVVGPSGKPYRMGMVFRCNLDGSEVETLAWNFRNNYEVAVDSFGTLWQSDNDDDGNEGVRISYVMEYGNFGYQDEMTGASWRDGWETARLRGAPAAQKVFYEWHQYDPGVVPNLLHTGAGSPTGIAVYEGKLLPEIFRNQMIHCDAGPRVVRAYPVRNDGAGYRAEIRDMVSSPDTWFRPSDVCVAPDGSVLIADWNDAGVGGHNMADQKRDAMTGRVYRLSGADAASSAPHYDFRTPAGCAQALLSPNMATRYLAWTRLSEFQRKAEKPLKQIWAGSEPRMRARALQLLTRIKGRTDTYLKEAIADRDADIRITGLRIARELKSDVVARVRKLQNDASPQVRRECAIALRHNSDPAAPAIWAELAAQFQAGDRWYVEALGIGADRQWDAFLAAWLTKVGDNWNTAGGREIVWRSRAEKTPQLLATLLSDLQLIDAERTRYFRAFDFLTAPEKQAALLSMLKTPAFNSGAVALEVLNRLRGANLESNLEVLAAVRRALEQVKGTARFVEMVRDFKLSGQEEALMTLAEQQPNTAAGTEAVRLLLRRGEHARLQKEFVAARNAAPSAVSNQVALALALGNSGDKEIVPLLGSLVSDPSVPTALRRQAVRSLAQIQPGCAALLKFAREEKLPDDLKLLAGSELASVRWQSIKTEAEKLLPPPNSADSKPLPPVAELLKLKGDTAKGAAVYRRDAVGCIKCHQVGTEGSDFGPNLADIGTKLGKDALYEAILEPSAGISFGYEGWQLFLKNGDDASGLLVSETADELAIKAVGGIVSRYKKSDVTARTQQRLSLMPADLQKTMSAQDLVDLVEYLTTLRQASPVSIEASKKK